jgi:glycosyltransferase involved in cell wall biosynthesis
MQTSESFKAQEVNNSQQIIVAAPSSDNSHLLAESLRTDNTLVQILPPKGIFNAMNEGWRKADSEWIIFLNAGDKFASSRSLQGVIDHLQHCMCSSGLHLYGGIVVSENWSKVEIPKIDPTPWNFAYGRLRVIHPSVVFRRRVLEELAGYDEHYEIAADFDLILRALRFGACSSGHILSIFHTGGVSTTQIRKSAAEAKEIRIQNLKLESWGKAFDSLWRTYRKIQIRSALSFLGIRCALQKKRGI